MGAVYLGSVLNDQEKVIEILGLPELTFPVVGVGFGYPAERPGLKPRMAPGLKFFENRYRVSRDILGEIAAYDSETAAYYEARENGARSETFSDQVLERLELDLEKRAKIVNIIRKQGFDLKLD